MDDSLTEVEKAENRRTLAGIQVYFLSKYTSYIYSEKFEILTWFANHWQMFLIRLELLEMPTKTGN